MQSVPSTKFIQNFAQFSLEAQREPIAVTNHGRVTGYFMSAHEYAELQKLKATQRQSFNIASLPDDEMHLIMKAEVDPKYDHLNALLDDNSSRPKG